jgi:hypothetical protein
LGLGKLDIAIQLPDQAYLHQEDNLKTIHLGRKELEAAARVLVKEKEKESISAQPPRRASQRFSSASHIRSRMSSIRARVREVEANLYLKKRSSYN